VLDPKFLKSIIDAPTFSLIIWFGKPNVLNDFRNYGLIPSYGSSSMVLDILMEFELKYSFCSLELHDEDCVISKAEQILNNYRL